LYPFPVNLQEMEQQLELLSIPRGPQFRFPLRVSTLFLLVSLPLPLLTFLLDVVLYHLAHMDYLKM